MPLFWGWGILKWYGSNRLNQVAALSGGKVPGSSAWMASAQDGGRWNGIGRKAYSNIQREAPPTENTGFAASHPGDAPVQQQGGGDHKLG